MIVAPAELRHRVQTLLELDGTILTEPELARMVEHYPRCEGKEVWDVREYARHNRLGGREYRVVRGASIQDVFASGERSSATAVRTALNEMELQGS